MVDKLVSTHRQPASMMPLARLFSLINFPNKEITMRFAVTSVVLFLSATTAWAAEDESDGDQEMIQGEWSYTTADRLGRNLLFKETFVGRKMIYSISDAEGKVLLMQEFNFELRKNKDVRVITFSDPVVLLGPKNQDKRLKKKIDWLYRITGDRMIQCKGLLKVDAGPEWTVSVWVRSPKKTADARSRNDKDNTKK